MIADLREQHERELGKDLAAMAGAWRGARQLRAFLGAVEEGTPAELKTEGFCLWLRRAGTTSAGIRWPRLPLGAEASG